MSKLNIDDRVLDGKYNGPVTVEIREDLEVTGLDALTEFSEGVTRDVIAAKLAANKAAISAKDASNEVVRASNEANRAKTEADKAKQVSGLDTVDQAVDMAMAEFAGMMTESEARAIQWQNENVNFDASGMVNTGKHRIPTTQYTPINEGLYTNNQVSNALNMGRTTSSDGTSKTDFPVMHIAGATVNLLNIHQSYEKESRLLLPQAPDGTQVGDSAGDVRGSGKAYLDLKTDIDPKYGNVPAGSEAQILREAVSRAFEGGCKNGDFRLGNVNWSNLTSVVDGVARVDDTAACDSSDITLTAGVEYELSMFINDIGTATNLRVRNADGSTGYEFQTSITTSARGEYLKYRFTPLTSGVSANILVYPAVVGRWVEFSQVSIKPVTEQVVTYPVDGIFIESYDEELKGRVEIMENIQSLSTTFGTTSVPTVLSTRKLSYFQQYDGQFPEVTADPDFINDRYRCVVWTDLTEPQKREIAAYMGEKLFMGVNGFPVNTRNRARTIRGAGNGDWNGINSTQTSNFYLQFDSKSRYKPQGKLDATPEPDNTFPLFAGNSEVQNYDYKQGIFTALDGTKSPSSVAYQGRCFLYLVATVPRSNKGAYHEKLNPYGTRMHCQDGGNGSRFWHESSAVEILTEAQCFDVGLGTTGNYASIYSGDIASGKSGHPDGIFYDGITAGGLNGVIDWRLGAVANDSPAETSKTLAKVESKIYRGLEKLVRTEIHSATQTSVTGSVVTFDKAVPDHLLGSVTAGQTAWLEQHDGSYVERTIIQVFSSGSMSFNAIQGRKPDSKVVFTFPTNLSVSGEFHTKMVIGDPANILLTDALKNGWLGTWCPVIPDGSLDNFPISRQGVDGLGTRSIPYTRDNGVTWQTANGGGNETTNQVGLNNWPADTVTTFNYKAWAKPTKKSENKPVYNGKAGLMPVIQLADNRAIRGSTLAESLIGKVLTSNSSPQYGALSLTQFTVLSDSGKVLEDARWPLTHSQLTLATPTNNSPAVKVLPYQISDNGLGSIGFQANELTWKDPVITEETATTTTVVKGSIYRPVTGSGATSLMYVTVQATYSGGIKWANYSLIGGKIFANSDLTKPTPNMVVWDGSGWGDDDKIKITTDGSDTFVDRNGTNNLSVVHELAIPCTWVSNRARAGTQVEGVDL